jgi:lysyl-tRNA synthetase, class II
LQFLPLQPQQPNLDNKHSLRLDDDTMADNQQPPADQAAEAVAKLHLDEVTGEMISKTELKKRQKQRDKEAAKKQKEASKPAAAATSSKAAEAKEKDLTPNQYFEIRSKVVNDLHAKGKAYPHKVCCFPLTI